jgi:hypothetical protein
LTAVALLAAPACGQDLYKASAGYTYFHHTGADMTAHNTVVEACIADAASVADNASFLASTMQMGGAIANVALGFVSQAQLRQVNRIQFAANVENCMVANGWDVVHLDDTDGARLAALPAPQQADTLAAWVGAAAPHGVIVRSFSPISGQITGRIPIPADRVGPTSLSLTAGDHEITQIVRSSDAAPPEWHSISFVPPGSADAASAVIVIRTRSAGRYHGTFWLAQLGDAPASPNTPIGLSYIQATTPAGTPFSRAGNEKTYVAIVPPGRWRLIGYSGVAPSKYTGFYASLPTSISLCLGGPAFDVKPGQAVFAGSFDASAADFFKPNLDPAPAKADLGDTPLAARLEPAHWTNGEKTPCNLLWGRRAYEHTPLAEAAAAARSSTPRACTVTTSGSPPSDRASTITRALLQILSALTGAPSRTPQRTGWPSRAPADASER